MSTTQDAKEEINIAILLVILIILLSFVFVESFSKKNVETKKEAYRTKIQELNNRIKQIEIQKQKLAQELNALENKNECRK